MLKSPLSPKVLPTNHPHVLYYPNPGANFQPETASAHDLAEYGYASRPAGDAPPAVLERWLRNVHAKRIEPSLKATRYKHAPNKPAGGVSTLGANYLANSINWSGAVLQFQSPIFTKFSNTASILTIVPQNFNSLSAGLDDHCSIWVGFDGYGDTDVCQAGIHLIGTVSTTGGGFGGATQPVYAHYAWIEWFPDFEIQVQNLPINPGNQVEVAVSLLPGNSAQANIWNLTTNQQVSLVIHPPAGVKFVGKSVEWILERPEINGVLSSLFDFGTTSFTLDANSYPPPKYYDLLNTDGGSAYFLTMVNTSNSILSKPTIAPAINRNGLLRQDMINFQFQTFN